MIRQSLRSGVSRVDSVAWAVIGLTLVALLTRVAGLDLRAVHHDESLHLYYAWQLSLGAGYEHNPLMHGPLQFHLIAAFFWLFGDSDFVGRLPHALAGTALVGTPLLFRRWMKGPAVVLAAAFLLLSPSILYYSRFARNEPFVALFTVLMVWAVLEYRRTGRLGSLLVFSAAFALQFAAKETGYLITAVFLLYLNAWAAHDLFWGPRRALGESPSLARQARASAVLVPVAWVIAILWRPLRTLRGNFGWHARPRSVDLLVLTIALVLPLLPASAEIPLLTAGGALDDEQKMALARVAVPIAFGLSLVAGLLWRPYWWAACVVVCAAILVPLYTTFGANPAGAGGIVWTSLDYWVDQQEVGRGWQPWFYYVWMLALYEPLVSLPAVLGGTWLVVWRRDWLAALLLFWFVGMFVGLTAAGEKMPWLTVHLALPLAFLAAHVLGQPLPGLVAAMRAGRGAAWRWASASAMATTCLLLVALAVRIDWGLNRLHPDTPVEPMIYVQTSPDVPPLAVRMRSLIDTGAADRVVVLTEQSLTWPWAWYLRDLPVTYVVREQLNEDVLRPGDIVIVVEASMPLDGGLLARYEPPEPYVHRWWFAESAYRATTLQSLWDDLRGGALFSEWPEFLIWRGDPDSIGELRAEIYMPRVMPAGGGG
ncbi:MAG: TIGR03663 family protein [Chloroflexi bacterium]|nr:TIGR03663 family protein [Chloroflexota bacterium]